MEIYLEIFFIFIGGCLGAILFIIKTWLNKKKEEKWETGAVYVCPHTGTIEIVKRNKKTGEFRRYLNGTLVERYF
ncbi:MAG: hypothetical protein HY773_02580 [Candidatus Terrybacteria bacterium]|nr:hypothetical protein [Candidatus Terrybacteria bacterium]